MILVLNNIKNYMKKMIKTVITKKILTVIHNKI
jgi:hypothetical protein